MDTNLSPQAQRKFLHEDERDELLRLAALDKPIKARLAPKVGVRNELIEYLNENRGDGVLKVELRETTPNCPEHKEIWATMNGGTLINLLEGGLVATVDEVHQGKPNQKTGTGHSPGYGR